MEEFFYESNGNRKKDRRPGKGGNPQGDPQDAADPGGDAAGNLYGPGGGNYPEEIFAHRRAGNLRQAVRGVPSLHHRADGVRLRPRPGDRCGGGLQEGASGEKYQQTAGDGDRGSGKHPGG